MAEIDTGINIDVPIKSYSDTPAVSVGRKTAQRDVGADALAKALKDISPVFEKWVTAKEKERATSSTLEGANAINGMTLEEAREAHKAGFPDIQNPWARYGAYKQYASNSADKLLFDFQKEYEQNKYNKDYNWETAWSTKTNDYLSGKDDDVYFQNAYNDTNIALRKWINSQELEKQSEELTTRVKTDTLFSIKKISDKINTKLMVDFSENYALAHDFDDEGYHQAKNEFFNENFQKYWDEEYELIRENLNPAISKADLDGLVVDAAEYHVATDGRFINQYAKMLTEKRPDGTPPIFANPKYSAKVSKILDDMKKAGEVMNFGNDFIIGNTAKYDQADYNKLSSEYIKKRAVFHKSQNPELDDNQAIGLALLELMPSLKKNNRPVPYVKNMLNAPIGTTPTRDNRLAFQVAVFLDQNGMLGQYFSEGNRNSVMWSIAINKFKAGGGDMNSVDEIIKSIGNYQSNFLKLGYSILSSTEKESLATRFSDIDIKYPRNRSMLFAMAEYFKNVVGTGWEDELENWVDRNYTVYNDKYYSKNILQEMGIQAEEFDYAKEVVAGILVDELKLNKDKGEVVESDLDILMEDMALPDAFGYLDVSDEDLEGKKTKVKGSQLILEDYELTLNPQDGTLSLSVAVGDIDYQLPATFTTKDGSVYQLNVPVNIFRAKLEELAKIQKEKVRLETIEKDKKHKKKMERIKAIEETDPFGQGEIYKF